MGFVRFVIDKADQDSGRRQGLFQALAALDDNGELHASERHTYEDLYEWFRKNLRRPRSFTRSSKPHAKKVAISWFKDTAHEHIRRMRRLADVLEAHGIQITMIRTERPGYIVYEDRHQVAAEPFSDTGA